MSEGDSWRRYIKNPNPEVFLNSEGVSRGSYIENPNSEAKFMVKTWNFL